MNTVSYEIYSAPFKECLFFTPHGSRVPVKLTDEEGLREMAIKHIRLVGYIEDVHIFLIAMCRKRDLMEFAVKTLEQVKKAGILS